MLGMLAGCEFRAGLNWEVEVARCQLAISELKVGLSWELEVVRAHHQ